MADSSGTYSSNSGSSSSSSSSSCRGVGGGGGGGGGGGCDGARCSSNSNSGGGSSSSGDHNLGPDATAQLAALIALCRADPGAVHAARISGACGVGADSGTVVLTLRWSHVACLVTQPCAEVTDITLGAFYLYALRVVNLAWAGGGGETRFPELPPDAPSRDKMVAHIATTKRDRRQPSAAAATALWAALIRAATNEGRALFVDSVLTDRLRNALITRHGFQRLPHAPLSVVYVADSVPRMTPLLAALRSAARQL